MLVVAIEEAEPGMKLVMSVMHPEHPEQELLKPGFLLDATVLQRLREMQVPFLYVDYPDLAELDKHLMPYLSPARQMVYSQIKKTIAAVQRTARPTVTFPDYYSATRELVLTLLQSGDHPIYLDLLSGIGTDAVSHATAVSQLALTLGIRLEQYLINQRRRLPARHAREVVNLGVAAMLHDIGKSRLPAELQSRSGINPPEDAAQRTEWETHAAIGSDMLRHGIEPSAVAAVTHHHQHFDGSGFPPWQRQGMQSRPREGTEIHIFARILTVADLYDRLTVREGGRRWPVEILHLLQTQYSAWIDPVILGMLPKVVPPFPPGSRVTLSDGSAGIVVKCDPEDPYDPIVRRVVDGRLKLSEEVTHTGKESGLSIRELSGINVEKFIPVPEKAAA